MRIKYDSNWLFKSEIGFGTYLHLSNDAVLVSNRIAHVQTKTYRITLQRFNHPRFPFYKFDCRLCYDDAKSVTVTKDEFNSVILEVLKEYIINISDDSIISFVSELNDNEYINLYNYLIKQLKSSGNILYQSDFSALSIPTDNNHKFLGFSKNKNIKRKSLLSRLLCFLKKN
jgi:hypothetical protein